MTQGNRGNFDGRPGKLERVHGLLSRVAGSMGLERRMREHTVLSLWSKVVDEPFRHCTRPLFIDFQGNIVVAARDGSVAQELSLSKTQTMAVLKRMARTLGVELNGLRIDLKHFHTPATSDNAPEPEERLPEPSKEELAAVPLDEQQLRLIGDLEESLPGNVMTKKIVQSARRRLQTINWRKAHGYPICGECGLPAQRLDDNKVCFTCLLARKFPPPQVDV